MRIVRLVLMVAFASIAVTAQYSVVTEAEYKTACGYPVPAPAYTRAESYRMTIETKSSREGQPSTDYASRSVSSYQDRMKWHRLTESTFGSSKRIREQIGFDGKVYSREGDGEWKEEQSGAGIGTAATKSETRYLNIEYRLYPDDSVRGQTVKVCEKYEVSVEKNSGSDAETHRESTSKYWVSREGMLRSETAIKSANKKFTHNSWSKIDWEIDSSIKVTVPAKFAQSDR